MPSALLTTPSTHRLPSLRSCHASNSTLTAPYASSTPLIILTIQQRPHNVTLMRAPHLCPQASTSLLLTILMLLRCPQDKPPMLAPHLCAHPSLCLHTPTLSSLALTILMLWY
ncbi:hypothetical protein O181_116926 [Austropuccinia psidii MF-1]|uniref:Uncharacterized protein n=1 Tax=Austropuccinia psidii MF-1 TaxID=1389203 RepID=A0A9Q3KBQ5_9BASI|nr:hypothetical protein [Austropuccinia psidii MF-1]